MNGHTEEDVGASLEHVFDQFVTAVTCKSILTSFHQLLDLTGLRHADHSHFYEKLKAKLKGSWKAQSLWAKLDKRASHREYKKGQACKNMKVLIIGAGPCGMRTAIECALLGARTVVVEKRDRFSRNNVLHLWPYLITDLRNLGAKKFFGKFCAGAIDHISIRQLQCILLKVALLLGVEVHCNVTFEGLIEPPEDPNSGIGWRCKVSPENHALSEFELDVLIGADGKRNTLPGFKRKEFRGKLAIAVTANFINRNTQAEARVEEISGVAFIFNQKFFLDLKETTRIDLENIVYYKDDTHYFVMTAKKASLLEKGVLKEDHSDTVRLLDRDNVNQDALMAYAREAADFSTNSQLPSLDYAVNHYGQADVAMFDFTSMFAAENASRFLFKNGHHLLMGLVGDSLLEPFWPTGSGCARGFLGAFDAAWMIRSWAMGKTPLQVLAERESIFTVLSQTTPNYLHKNHNSYTIDPNSRYPNLNLRCVKPGQVRHLYEGGQVDEKELEEEEQVVAIPSKKPRNAELTIDSYSLLRWCQRVLNTGKYRDVHVVDFTSSWRSGLALCALIHSFRPELINNTLLMECEVAVNNQLAFNVAEKELGIPPVMSGEDMAKHEVPDKLTMVAYLTQFYELFKHEPLPSSIPLPVKSKRKSTSRDAKQQPKSPRSPNRRISFLQKLSSRLAKSKKRKEQEENEGAALASKKLKEREEIISKGEVELTRYSKLPMEEIANRLQLDRKPEDTKVKVSKTEEMSGAVSVTAMADLLVAKFKSYETQPVPEPVRRLKGQPTLLAASSASEFCSFCHKRVYIMERMSAEGEFFHRQCLKCDHCGVGLRLTNYSCDRDAKPVKFYCYRHALPELRLRPQRKRGLEDELKENVPETVITPAPDVDTGQASKQKSPRRAASSHLTPLLLPPSDMSDKPKKTPERVEFEISFDGAEEESEEEQFEFNLRASLSSDTLLDDEDESDLSDSDIESGAEDEVWENAVESLKSSGTPLTLEEAFELRGSWRRQHSQENLIDAVEQERATGGGAGYTRLGVQDGEEEGSSTEVEEESEYETDTSDEEDSDEDRTDPTKSGSTETSLKSPVSPVSKLSASKASFFSEPPKVVSLDPWSMFGMGKDAANKESEKITPSEDGVKVKRKKSSASDRKKSSSSDSKSRSERKKSTDSRKDVSSKDTDISESLELDPKSQEVFLENGERVSEAGSLEEIKEDLGFDAASEVPGRVRNKSVDSQESLDEREKKPQSILKRGSVDNIEAGELAVAIEVDRGSEGDDERMEGDEDDMLEKTAVSKAMEQLLLDIDHRSFSKDSSASENFLNDTSDSADNEMYVEGRLSPSANKTRKFRMKRHARRSKERRVSRSTTSDSEAGRTDPTTTDNSQPRSSISRSPSTELGDGESVDVITPISEQPKSTEEETVKATDLIHVEEPVEKDRYNDLTEKKETEESVSLTPTLTKQEENLSATGTGSVKLDTETGDDSLAQVLAKAAAMSDLSDNSDLDELLIKNVDDRFVTDRRKPSQTKKRSKLNKLKRKQVAEKVKPGSQEELQVNSSFSISTPSSGSEDSVSSIDIDEFAGQILDVEGDEDVKPDREMMRDYTTTMSIALGESYSDEGEEVEVAKEKRDTVTESDQAESDIRVPPETEGEDKSVLGDSAKNEEADVNDDTVTPNNSSLFATPETSIEKGENDIDVPSSISPPARRPLPKPRSLAPVPQPRTSVPLSPKDKGSPSPKETTPVNFPASPATLSPPPRNENRDSSENELFLSPAESFAESPLINKSSTHPQTPTSPTKSSSDTKTKISKPSDSVVKDNMSSKPKSTSSSIEPPPNTTTTAKSQRKLPQLPKLNVPSRQPLRPTAATKAVDQPVMCSSPKLSNKLASSSTSNQEFKRPVRPLPVPGSASQPHVNKSSTSIPNTVNKSSTNSLSNITKSSTQASNHKVTTPVSPPVFKAPAKTKVPLDKSKLKLGSSFDRIESDSETERKKISANGIIIDNPTEDDIPFADESEAEEKFYTPCAPDKKSKPKFNAQKTDSVDARRRILPSPQTVHKSQPAVLSADQIRDIQRADIEKAKHQARERARLMSDEELGLDSAPNSPSRMLSKPTLGKTPDKNVQSRRSASYDTPSTSDVLSDSDDRLSSVPTATSSATEGDQLSQPTDKSDKKKKVKTPKNKKEKKGKREKKSESERKEKKKSLLSLIIPTKTSDKGVREGSHVLSSDSTPKGSDDNSKPKKSKTPRAKKSTEKKGRFSKSQEDLDKTPTAENRTDLAICSVFHSEASNRQARNELGVGGSVKKTIPVAPRASVDELSDSDESHISFSTMQRRRDEDLDERVARRMKKMQLKQQKQAEQKRLRSAQEIQRQLEEVEVRQKELEERGIAVEKALRGDGPEGENVDESQLMNEWFTLVHEKNALLRYESELNVRAKELELEDRQARLETDFRERSKKPETNKTDGEIAAEGNLLDELLEVVEQRNTLVAMLEEDRLREQKEDKDLKDMMLQKGYVLSPLSYDTRRERQKLEAPIASL